MNLDLLKGLLIILVIIDHNEFSRSLFPAFLYGMTFHVVGFMAIPFLKPPPKDFAAYVFRLYYPFLLVTVAMALAVWWTTRPDPVGHMQQLLLALYSGNASLLKSVTQMGLLWFLPSFIALVTMRSAMPLPLMLAVAVLAHPFIGSHAVAYQDWLPMGLLPALYMFPLCVLIAWLHRRFLAGMLAWRAGLAMLLAFGVIKSAQIGLGIHNEVGFADVADYRSPLALLLNDLEGVSGTLMLFQVARFNWSTLVAEVGKFSMQVYLFHAFVALALYKIIMMVAPQAGALPLFCLSLAGTIVLTLLLSKLLVGQAFTKRMVFPKGPGELLGAIGHRGR